VTALLWKSTQDLSARAGSIAGSLLNVSFANALEIITGIFAIKAGLIDTMKASLVGSIVQNILLVIGLSMFFGGLKYRDQKFSRRSVGVSE
jgi:Ca2+:H+ antiporter